MPPPSCSPLFVLSASFDLDNCSRPPTLSSVPQHANYLGVHVASHQPAAHGVQLACKLSTILWRESTDFTTSLLSPDAMRQPHHRVNVGIAFLPRPGGGLIIDGQGHGLGCPNDQVKHVIVLCFRNRTVRLGVVLNELPESAASHAGGVG
jgi:hypothetical protein